MSLYRTEDLYTYLERDGNSVKFLKSIGIISPKKNLYIKGRYYPLYDHDDVKIARKAFYLMDLGFKGVDLPFVIKFDLDYLNYILRDSLSLKQFADGVGFRASEISKLVNLKLLMPIFPETKTLFFEQSQVKVMERIIALRAEGRKTFEISEILKQERIDEIFNLNLSDNYTKSISLYKKRIQKLSCDFGYDDDVIKQILAERLLSLSASTYKWKTATRDEKSELIIRDIVSFTVNDINLEENTGFGRG